MFHRIYLFQNTKNDYFPKNKNYLLYSYYLGTVLFLEEDHFVTEDFIHVLKLMEKEQEGVAKEVKKSNLEI